MSFEYDYTHSNRTGLNARLDALDTTATVWRVSVKPKKSKRTLPQNKWARKFAAEFGKHTGDTPDRAYDILMYKCNPVFITDPQTNVEIRLAGHFSGCDTAEGAEVQKRMIGFGIDLGFYFDEA